jgi:flagellar secretion chaperone FliS
MKGIDAYKETAVTTQNKGRLIILLYEGAIKFMRLAIEELNAGNYEAKGRYITKAQDIINELNTVLDTERGGQIASNLRSLYAFMNNHLAQANIKRDPEMIRQVIKLAEELNDSFKAISS